MPAAEDFALRTEAGAAMRVAPRMHWASTANGRAPSCSGTDAKPMTTPRSVRRDGRIHAGQGHLQMVARLAAFGRNPQAMSDAPRFRVENGPVLNVESHLPRCRVLGGTSSAVGQHREIPCSRCTGPQAHLKMAGARSEEQYEVRLWFVRARAHSAEVVAPTGALVPAVLLQRLQQSVRRPASALKSAAGSVAEPGWLCEATVVLPCSGQLPHAPDLSRCCNRAHEVPALVGGGGHRGGRLARLDAGELVEFTLSHFVGVEAGWDLRRCAVLRKLALRTRGSSSSRVQDRPRRSCN